MPFIVQSHTSDCDTAHSILEGRIAGPGEGCDAVAHGNDPTLADPGLTAASQEFAASTAPNLEFPKIGAADADKDWVSGWCCGGSAGAAWPRARRW